MKGSYKILEQMVREINLSPLEYPARLENTITDNHEKKDTICVVLFDMGSEHNYIVKDERTLSWYELVSKQSKETLLDEMSFEIIRSLILNNKHESFK